jgi:hypothetical protein
MTEQNNTKDISLYLLVYKQRYFGTDSYETAVYLVYLSVIRFI